MAKHRWAWQEMEELFYQVLLRDHRSEDYTAAEMRAMAQRAAIAVPRTSSRTRKPKAHRRGAADG